MGLTRRKKANWTKSERESSFKLLTKRLKLKLCRNRLLMTPPSIKRSSKNRSSLTKSNNIVFYDVNQNEPLCNTNCDNTQLTSYLQQKFKGVEVIGSGSFSIVVKATEIDSNVSYAIKINHNYHSNGLREISKLHLLPASNYLIQYFSAWQQYEKVYLKFELCLTSLANILLLKRQVKEHQCWIILNDVARGLKALHDSNLVHMDIKPANIMVTSKGLFKIGDFGLVTKLDDRKIDAAEDREGDSKYVACEVLQHNTIHPAIDIFSLGMMMLEISSDAVLPGDGHLWHLLRNDNLPECFLYRKLSNKFRVLIKRMLQAVFRPSADNIIQCTENSNYNIHFPSDGRMKLIKNFESHWIRFKDRYQINNPGLSDGPDIVPIPSTSTTNNKQHTPNELIRRRLF